jgi:hypothetical protein
MVMEITNDFHWSKPVFQMLVCSLFGLLTTAKASLIVSTTPRSCMRIPTNHVPSSWTKSVSTITLNDFLQSREDARFV